MDLKKIQLAIQRYGFDGWLFYDFANRDPISYRILGLDEHKHTSRRWFYFIPSAGTPQKLCSKVEPRKLDSIPGDKQLYLRWQDQHQILKEILSETTKIAMNFSPKNNIPYVSMIDYGTGELIRSFGVEIGSSMDLIQEFEGLLSEDAYKTHKAAQPIMHEITIGAFNEIGKRLKKGEKFTEVDIQKWMIDQFKLRGLLAEDLFPEVAVNEHAADPHFDSSIKTNVIKPGDLVLIDSWSKLPQLGSIYYDFTMMAYIGDKIPSRIQDIWDVVCQARDRAVALEKEKFAQGIPCYGWELDKVARDYINDQGFGDYFVHRLGHSIGQEVHGNAVHLDSLETQDERQIVPGVLHSVEPGIYIPEEKIGVRSEIDVFVNYNGEIEVTGPIQTEIYKILI